MRAAGGRGDRRAGAEWHGTPRNHPMNSPPPAVARAILTRGETQIEILAQGEGPPVVLLPSLGRGAADFERIAVRLAGAGLRVLRPQPRGIGASRGPMTGIDLHDYAADIAAVIEHDIAQDIVQDVAQDIAREGGGGAFVAGHAFGNRVARMLATDRPDLVRAVSLIAANVGHAPSPR